MKKYFIFITLLGLFSISVKANESCQNRYKNNEFWSRYNVSISGGVDMVNAEAVLNDIRSAVPVTNQSALATQGFNQMGNCVDLILTDNVSVASGIYANTFSLSALSLKNSALTMSFLNALSNAQYYIGDRCMDEHNRLVELIKNRNQTNPTGKFSGEAFLQETTNGFLPIARKLYLTTDGKFVLALTESGTYSDGRQILKQHQVCAFSNK